MYKIDFHSNWTNSTYSFEYDFYIFYILESWIDSIVSISLFVRHYFQLNKIKKKKKDQDETRTEINWRNYNCLA